MRSRRSASVWAVVPLVLLFACSDGGPTAPQDQPESVPLQLSANLNGTPVQTLVVEVTAADIATPLAYNLHVNNGQASGSIQIPPGEARTITVRAFDTDGTVTHEGSATVNVVRGNNPPVQIPLVPRSGHQPIALTLAEVSVTVTPALDSIVTGEALQLAATVIAAGGTLDVDPTWATLNPAIASVSEEGLVTAIAGGTVVVVATYAGVGAAATITVLTGSEVWWYADADDDGFGNAADAVFLTVAPAGYVADDTDCNDANAAINPDATELLDGIDNDCDGTPDDGFAVLTWYRDQDNDTWGHPFNTIQAAFRPVGYVDRPGDCNDFNAAIFPGAIDFPFDGVDSNCNGSDF